MGTITLGQAAQWCGGYVEPKYADITFLGASNDTRKLQPGQLFVALVGERDGHDFIPAALGNGAAAVLCTRTVGDHPAIVVEDTRKALGDIARGERLRIGMKVVGVTGSVGKSTTKEMICAVLSENYRVRKTPENHNNDIGMPMAILAMPEDTQIAVLEMGMNHFREIAYLASIAQPDIAVITNIGTMHIEHLGSRQGILQAKLEILEGMGTEGKLLLNGDDTLLWNLHGQQKIELAYFGVENPQCAYLAKNIQQSPGNIHFDAEAKGKAFGVDLELEGMHYVIDAMAAIGVGTELGVPEEKLQRALLSFQNMAGRQEIFEAKGCTIIKDCYNAGPESMTAALSVLGNKTGRRVAVLGDMLELGVCTQAEHYRVGRIAAEKADVVLAYGPNSSRVISGALTGGMSPAMAKCFEKREDIAEAMIRVVRPGDVILVKGSRGMRMELILDQFLKDT
ncbi:MAG: UDP-N-acetylmuramoyl-tripeptide--D-alanyl-D-alanine ligase [Ruminococcaceae bacterium]|nr:UDP-N-acetylmuramoyl-tripeptide--D-alanyl-D-alanine ligase [Oscillospiraceae bacterium]MBQ3214937.1 UDP-N-acetylmuramoyl-tripeptide--D-alanyl-D-alanine ligase [Oscillospiraceae bacterium]